jgi:hypothetical protein
LIDFLVRRLPSEISVLEEVEENSKDAEVRGSEQEAKYYREVMLLCGQNAQRPAIKEGHSMNPVQGWKSRVGQILRR